ncbi:hypothetical protein BGW80DRAFT_1257164 [Lactifluus volemus]|nr:hypothetical protein BGW80DRAFT_1257164 [Lactifluus volemus]
MEKIRLPTLKDCSSIPDDYAKQRIASAVKFLLYQMPFCSWHYLWYDFSPEGVCLAPVLQGPSATGSIRQRHSGRQHIGVLPKPFQEYGFFNIGNSFAAAAAGSHLGLQPSRIADAMGKASVVLRQSGGDGSLGLNEYGESA